MPNRATGEHSEASRAFLQSRVALLWKVWFFFGLISMALSTVGAITEPGVNFVFDVAGTAQAGIFWHLCRRGQRSIRFSRAMETGGLLIQLTLATFMMRYIVASFAKDHPVASLEGLVMTDGYVSMMMLGGATMMVAIRAALIPSRPGRTIIVTAVVGIPLIVVSTVLVPTGDGGLAWRALDSPGYPLLPVNAALLWSFVIVTCAIISKIVYGLRVEVREARQLGQYVLEKKLGEGGMGEVYRARHGMMRRPSAVKLLKTDQVGETGIRRFEQEVQLTARLTHPNTITIYDYGRTDDGVFYYAMELLDGVTLQRLVDIDGAQPPSRVVHIMAMACRALTEAHAIGLIHRDIKPANIMLCTQGGELDVVKVLDFGLVKQLDMGRDVALTNANAITGTPQYMAPESIRDPELVDARTDIYALGAVAYYLLAGTAVFDGKTVVEVCGQHLHETPPPLSTRGLAIAPELEAVVLACLSKDPKRRPQTMLELRCQLEACEIEPWRTEQAQTWWQEHAAELDGDDKPDIASTKTIAIDADRTLR